MNPGLTDEAGKAAGATIEALKSTPVVLALVIFNVLYMLGTFWSQGRVADTFEKAAERWKSLTESVMQQCGVQAPRG